jgi:RNA polymerase sigma factor (TIGR02999 family)
VEVTSQTTVFLQRMNAGDAAAAEELLPLIYDELRALAGSYMRGRAAGHTLQPTALVNEAWMRLIGRDGGQTWESRAHFLGVAAKAMRSVLVDHARRKQADKRGGESERAALDEVIESLEVHVPDVLALDEALTQLAQMDPELARIVELKFFGGLTIDELARVIGRSHATIERGWKMARLWLKSELS